MISYARVCAAIVTYNPDIDLFNKVVSAVEKQVERIYIYDNSSINRDDIKKLLNDKYVVFVESDSNDGIAKALNVVCRLAINDGFDWVLTLDHDTVICGNFVQSCQDIVSETDKKTAIVCPRVNYLNLDVKEKGDVTERVSQVPACMTSGSFMSLKAWDGVGGFDESMVIDWVDNDICTNFVIHGFVILRNNQISMEHRLGNAIERKFWFGTLTDFQYSAFRIYHIVRNGIYYKRKYRNKINWIKISLINLSTRIKFRILYRKDKEKIASIKRAIKDGRKMELHR